MGVESARRAASWGGVPMKHISLVTVGGSDCWAVWNCTDCCYSSHFRTPPSYSYAPFHNTNEALGELELAQKRTEELTGSR